MPGRARAAPRRPPAEAVAAPGAAAAEARTRTPRPPPRPRPTVGDAPARGSSAGRGGPSPVAPAGSRSRPRTLLVALLAAVLIAAVPACGRDRPGGSAASPTTAPPAGLTGAGRIDASLSTANPTRGTPATT